MTCTDGIIKVLQQSKNNDEYIPMHYIDITNSIVENNFKEILGKTPQNTVSMFLSTNKELFEVVDLEPGYKLTTKGENYEVGVASTQKEEKEEAIIINQKIKENNESTFVKVFSMYCNRADISWEKVLSLL